MKARGRASVGFSLLKSATVVASFVAISIASAEDLQNSWQRARPHLEASSRSSQGGTTGTLPADGIGEGMPMVLVGSPPGTAANSKPDLNSLTVHVGVQRLTNVFEYFNLDGKCRPNQFKLEIESPPMHGTMGVRTSRVEQSALTRQAFGNSLQGGPDSRSTCSASTYSGALVLYKSADGYQGLDEAVISITDHNIKSKIRMLLVVDKSGNG